MVCTKFLLFGFELVWNGEREATNVKFCIEYNASKSVGRDHSRQSDSKRVEKICASEKRSGIIQ